jgi:hypothetical protein
MSMLSSNKEGSGSGNGNRNGHGDNGGYAKLFSHANSTVSTDSQTQSTTTTPQQQSFLEKQDEGVLRDVLEELDKERSMRAELEANIRVLEQQVAAHNTTNKKQPQSEHDEPSDTALRATVVTSSKEYIALETERNGYMEILDALTKDRPAFHVHSSKRNNNKSNNSNSLPPHVIHLLEIIPWDSRAQPHLFGQEQVYEWQIWNSQKNWQRQLRYFPTFFKTLPIVVPQPGRTVNEAPTSSKPPSQCVLTNLEVTQIFNIDRGYPLPQDGGIWEWIGGWRIEKSMETDDQGWSYSTLPVISASQSNYHSEHQNPTEGTSNIVKRRRKWTRSRVLVDYSHASESTTEYLKLVAAKAGLAISVEKLSDQLVETKMKLTTLEQDHLALKEETNRKIKSLEQEMKEKDKQIPSKGAVVGGEAPTASTSTSKVSNTTEQLKDVRSVVAQGFTQWVSDTVSKKPTTVTATNNDSAHDGNTISSDDDTAASEVDEANPSNSSSSKQQLFDWNKVRGGGRNVLDKIKLRSGDLPWNPLLQKQQQPSSASEETSVAASSSEVGKSSISN